MCAKLAIRAWLFSPIAQNAVQNLKMVSTLEYERPEERMVFSFQLKMSGKSDGNHVSRCSMELVLVKFQECIEGKRYA